MGVEALPWGIAHRMAVHAARVREYAVDVGEELVALLVAGCVLGECRGSQQARAKKHRREDLACVHERALTHGHEGWERSGGEKTLLVSDSLAVARVSRCGLHLLELRFIVQT